MRHVVALNERDGIVDIWFDEIFLLIVGEGFNRRIRNNIFGVEMCIRDRRMMAEA